MNHKRRVRFAPSPTGYLHIGGVRTALFNYLFARQAGSDGSFILRLEDTDRERFVADSVVQIQQALDWLGLKPDEGYWFGEQLGQHQPYSQHERVINEASQPHYLSFAKKLVDQGLAYYSHISDTDFNNIKSRTIAAKKPFVYRYDLEPKSPVQSNPNVPIRIKVANGETTWHDEIRGNFTTNHDLIDDFVIIKADGYPTYNFANVIDDHTMQISHVIRGDEFISSTAKHVLLYNLFGWQPPKFIHLPSILATDGRKKLSKRDNDVDILSYRERGFLPESIINYLSLLGWNDGSEKEIFSIDELIKNFSIKRIQTSPAVFDITRLEWMNGEYIRALPLGELAALLKGFTPSKWQQDQKYFKDVIALEQQRLKTLAEAEELLRFFFERPTCEPKLLLNNKISHSQADTILQNALGAIEQIDFELDIIEDTLRKLASSKDISTKDLFFTIRIAITGRLQAPGLFETMKTLGKAETIARINEFKSAIV